MRRLLIFTALSMSLALAVGPVSAAPGPGNGSLVAGSGWRLALDEVPRVEFTVAAKFGGNPAGSYRYTNVAGTDFTATITCGSVDSSVAVIGGNITEGNVLVGMDVLVFFVDNGSPTFGAWGPDQVSFTLVPEAGDVVGDDFPADFPDSCPAARGSTFQVQQLRTVIGDVVVH